jgi:hypothetical protein
MERKRSRTENSPFCCLSHHHHVSSYIIQQPLPPRYYPSRNAKPYKPVHVCPYACVLACAEALPPQPARSPK